MEAIKAAFEEKKQSLALAEKNFADLQVQKKKKNWNEIHDGRKLLLLPLYARMEKTNSRRKTWKNFLC
jgi:hypothetical protein